jgi:hypothetical protein
MDEIPLTMVTRAVGEVIESASDITRETTEKCHSPDGGPRGSTKSIFAVQRVVPAS